MNDNLEDAIMHCIMKHRGFYGHEKVLGALRDDVNRLVKDLNKYQENDKKKE